jgi:S1-C subfamily serine protease
MKSLKMCMGFLAMVGAGTLAGTPADAAPKKDAKEASKAASVTEYSPDLGAVIELTPDGIRVQAVRKGAGVDGLDLQAGDLIFGINGKHPESTKDLHNALVSGGDNEDHDVDVIRRGAGHVHYMLFHVGDKLYVHKS